MFDDIDFAMNVTGNEHPDAKYKIGDRVHFKNKTIFDYCIIVPSMTFVVKGSSDADDTIEYSLLGHPYLVWEYEIELVKE